MDAASEVKSRLSVEDVIGEYVQLKRAGRNWRGLSPWTSEKTPSLMVSPDKQIWHDFSSGKGGNIFSFVMELEGLDFKGALELLARKAGVDLEQYRTGGPGRGPSRERLVFCNEAAAHFFQVQFSKNRAALEYVLKRRQFTKATALNWRLGYSPSDGEVLIKYLRAKNFSESEIKRAGLTNSYGKPMFRGRLMIPLADPQGRIVGFTARQLSDEPNSPKYINTPATVIYDKSRHVFGLHLAKEAIRKTNYAVLAEGNLDVIASHQAGVSQVVATAGTALTTQHLKTLVRFTNDIRLAFDADKAGLAATERAIPLASRLGANLSIISIPSGKDPDELIKQDAEKWREIIVAPQYALDWLVEQYESRLDLSSAKGKREFSDAVLPIVRQLEDKVEQDHYLNKIAGLCNVSVEALTEKMTKFDTDSSAVPRRAHKQPAQLTGDQKRLAERAKLQEHLLAILLSCPQLLKNASLITPEMLEAEPSRAIWKMLKASTANPGKTAKPTGQDLAEYGKILRLEFEELYQGIEPSEMAYEVQRLQSRLIEQYVKSRKNQLGAELAGADEAESMQLLAEAKKLDILLKQATRGS